LKTCADAVDHFSLDGTGLCRCQYGEKKKSQGEQMPGGEEMPLFHKQIVVLKQIAVSVIIVY
jgi:hypothetical protein